MSLVDYASSSDEETEERSEPHRPQQLPEQRHSNSQPSSFYQTGSRQCQHSSEVLGDSSMGSITALPNASELFESSVEEINQRGNDHSSRVAVAMAASASRKRPETNGSAGPMPYRKLSRQNLPPSRIPPDTSGSSLIPPQLRGRSNVVTEDIDKLFVRKRKMENQNDASSVTT